MEKPSLEIGNSNWAIKEGELLGYNRAGNDYLPIPITMTRASLGTRVNPEGLVEDVELLGSDLITNGNFVTDLSGWDLQGTNATNTITWETNGARIISTGVNIGMAQTSVLTIGKTYKLTCDVNITLGKIGLDGATSGLTVNMVEGFNEIIFTAISTTFKIKRITGNDNCLLDNVSVKEATIDNLARVDYDGTASSLLVEPLRTNLTPYSEEISQYSKTQTTVIDNNTTSPDGTVNASKVTKNGASENDRVFVNNLVISNTTDYSLSAFIKNDDIVNGGVSTIGARITGGTLFRQGYEWNGSTLSITSSQGGGTRTNVLLEDFGNGWWKIGFSFTSDGTEADLEFDIDRVNGTDTTSIFLWGAQCEVGSYATSYIPTDGGTVTRVQDQYSKTGISNLIGSEGVLFVEMAALANDGTNRGISLNDGTATNRLLLYFSYASNQIAVISTGFTGSIIYTLPDETLFNKIAVRYKANDITLWVDGESRGTPVTSATIPTFTALKFDSGSGASPFFGKVKQLQVFKTALTDDELTILTGTSGVHFFPSYGIMASALTYTIE